MCGRRVPLDQGQISYRHDIILKVIDEFISIEISSVVEVTPLGTALKPIICVHCRQKAKKNTKQNLTEGIIDVTTDWVSQIDLRQQQTQCPPHIITTSDIPDIVVYSNSAKVVVIVELTCRRKHREVEGD